MLFIDFYLPLALAAILSSRLEPFEQFWRWSAWGLFFCDIILNSGQWYRRKCHFTLGLLVSSADNLCKQFGPRSALSGSELFDTMMVFLKEFFKITQQKSLKNYLACRVKAK